MTCGVESIDYTALAMKRLITQYGNSQNLKDYIRINSLGYNRLESTLMDVLCLRTLENANDYTLDIIGKIVGQSRVIVEISSGPFFGFVGSPLSGGFGSIYDEEIGSPFIGLGEDTSTSRYLTNDEFRTFIRARIFRNHTAVTVEDIITQVSLIFGGPPVKYENIEGEFAYKVTIGRELTVNEKLLINYSGLLPEPCGVGVEYFDTPAPTPPPPPPTEPPHSPLIWLDGADDSVFVLSSSDVESWGNKGTFGGVFVPSVMAATRGTRTADGVFLPNSSSSSATPSGLVCDIYGMSKLTTYFAVVSGVAVRPDSQALISRDLNFDPGASIGYQRMGVVTSDNTTYSSSKSSWSGSTANVSVPVPGINWEDRLLVRSVYGAASLFLNINSGEYLGSTPINSGEPYADRMFIGHSKSIVESTYYSLLEGTVHEIIAYNFELNESEIEEVEYYLTSKWGII